MAGDLLLYILGYNPCDGFIQMNGFSKLIFAGTLFFIPFSLLAQKTLVEGTVVYRAVVNNPDGSRLEGAYIISLKNKQVRKELKIGNDFENVMILDNSDKAYSLKSLNEKNFAVEVSREDFEKRNAKYYGPVIKDAGETKTIAGQVARKATVIYKDGTSVNIYYTKEWVPELPYTFERLQGLNGFPLAFEYKNEQGGIINFEAIKLNEDVVESSKFTVPANYKIISNEEYRQIRSK